MAIDPNTPSTLYLCICAYDVQYGGLFKTTDAGSSWTKVGDLDEPLHLVIDPKNSNHLYCVDGVRGNTIGFGMLSALFAWQELFSGLDFFPFHFFIIYLRSFFFYL
jgi:hypothetical protein